MTIEKPKDKDETRNCIGISLDLVDRSDEVVVCAIGRVFSKLSLSFACWKSSEVMPGIRRVSEACRGSSIQRRQVKVSW